MYIRNTYILVTTDCRRTGFSALVIFYLISKIGILVVIFFFILWYTKLFFAMCLQAIHSHSTLWYGGGGNGKHAWTIIPYDFILCVTSIGTLYYSSLLCYSCDSDDHDGVFSCTAGAEELKGKIAQKSFSFRSAWLLTVWESPYLVLCILRLKNYIKL